MVLKILKKRKSIKTISSFLLFAMLMLGMNWKVSAATYYGKTGVSPHLLGSWGNVSGGTGTAPTNFTTAGDIFIIESGVTMTASAAWIVGANLTTASTLQINSGGSLAMSTFLLTLASCNFTNAGNYTGSGGITISGTLVANSVAGFTTTGAVSMTKTAGTTTFAGNVNGSGLVINGTGGTLNLGSGLSHTFTGTWTRTAGTLNGGSSTLNLSATPTPISGTGGTFTAGTGTVNYSAAGNQTLAVIAYNNLTLSGSGVKTIGTAASGTLTSGNLSIAPSGSATASVTNTNISVGSLTLGGLGTVSGTWGAVAATSATNKTNTFFTTGSTGNVSVGSDTRITPTITIAPTATAITYGQTLASSTLSGGAGSVPGTFAFTTPSTLPNAGTTSQSVTFTPTNAANYNTVTTTVNVTVGTAALTITANNESKTYGATQSASASGAIAFGSTGLQNGETIGSVTLTYGAGALTAAAAVGSTSTITPSAATGGTFTASNYTISYTANSGTLTVAAATLTVTANTATHAYGTTLTAGAGSGAFSVTGMQNSETLTGTVTLAYTSGNTATSAVGTYTGAVAPSAFVKTSGTAALSNYTISYVTNTLSVTAVPLTITANNASKTYGQTFTTGTGSANFTSSGLINSETIGSITVASTGAVNTAAVGSYDIVPSAATGGTFTASNYSITYTNGTLTVGTAPLTIIAQDRESLYGSSYPLTISPLGPEVLPLLSTSRAIGLQNSDTIMSALASPNCNCQNRPPVGIYDLVPSEAVFNSGLASNYSITYVNATLTVIPKPLNVTANTATHAYGATLTAGAGASPLSVTGIRYSETLEGTVTLAYTSGNTATSAVGTYTGAVSPSAFVQTSGTATLSNYTINYITNTLSVTAAAVTVTANNGSKNYGQTFTTGAGSANFTSSGLLNDETIGSISIASTGAVNTAAVGSYNIVPSAATGGTFSASNYSITYTNGTLTVGTAALTITADNVVKQQGATLSTPVTVSTAFLASGLANDETIGSVTITYGAAAASGTAVGTYASQATPSAATGGTFTAANYTITYVSGNIIVGNARFSVATGNWNATATWSATSGGAGGASVPVAGDLVFIERGFTVTVTATAACGNIQVGRTGSTTAGAGTLTMNSNIALSVSGNLTVGGSGAAGSTGAITFNTGSSITANNLFVGGTATTPAAGTITMTNGGTLTLNGDITVNTAVTNTWTPGAGTLVLANTTTLPATIFTSFNNLTINSGATVTSGRSFSVGGTMTVNGSFVPGATTHVISGAGTLTGSGSVEVTLVSATALTTQYSIAKALKSFSLAAFTSGDQSLTCKNLSTSSCLQLREA